MLQRWTFFLIYSRLAPVACAHYPSLPMAFSPTSPWPLLVTKHPRQGSSLAGEANTPTLLPTSLQTPSDPGIQSRNLFSLFSKCSLENTVPRVERCILNGLRRALGQPILAGLATPLLPVLRPRGLTLSVVGSGRTRAGEPLVIAHNAPHLLLPAGSSN